MTFAGLWLPSADGSRHRLTRATRAIDMLYLGNESVGEGGLPPHNSRSTPERLAQDSAIRVGLRTACATELIGPLNRTDGEQRRRAWTSKESPTNRAPPAAGFTCRATS